MKRFKLNERLYDGTSYQQSFAKIAKNVNQGLTWKDIGDKSALERFKKIDSQVSEKHKGNYQYKLIAQSEPQIGFVIRHIKMVLKKFYLTGILEIYHKTQLYCYLEILKYLICLLRNTKVCGVLRSKIMTVEQLNQLHKNSDFS